MRRLARKLMERHGLSDWELCDLRDVAHACPCGTEGLCSPREKRLYFNFRRSTKLSKAKQRDLILHEIAHALSDNAHFKNWARTARRIGMRKSEIHNHITDAFVHEMNDYRKRPALPGVTDEALKEGDRMHFLALSMMMKEARRAAK
jgi:hypothetical protein